MSLDKTEVMNEIYNAGLITLGAVATSVASKKLAKEDLGATIIAEISWDTLENIHYTNKYVLN